MTSHQGKELRNLRRLAHAHGWRVERRGHGWGFFPPDSSIPPIFTGGTPSDYRSIHNFRAALRRAGLPLD